MNPTPQNNLSENFANKQQYHKLLWITLFAVAMGMLESSVVIYLRELYYPGGFQFPIKATSDIIAVTELLRELATLVMLLAIGILTGKNIQERLAWFIYSFAVWDVFYYFFLYLLIGWPVTLMDWDILFLLPVMWVGPVWAPLLLSLLMILLALFILHFLKNRHHSNLIPGEWIALISGSLIVIIAFCKEYYQFMTNHYPNLSISKLFFSKQTAGYAAQYIPVRFDFILFLLGCLVICTGIVMYVMRMKKVVKDSN